MKKAHIINIAPRTPWSWDSNPFRARHWTMPRWCDDAVFKLNKSYANRWQFQSLALWKSKLESSRGNFLCQAKEASHFLSAVVHKESSGINKFCILRCRIPGCWSPQIVCSNCSIVMGNCPLMTVGLPLTFGFILWEKCRACISSLVLQRRASWSLLLEQFTHRKDSYSLCNGRKQRGITLHNHFPPSP